MEIMKNSGTMHQGNSILSKTKANPSYKWTGIVSHIYKKEKSCSGLKTVFSPSNFDLHLNRLDLFAASYRAGNNGVRNEIVAIHDSMKKAGHITIEEFKKLHRSIL